MKKIFDLNKKLKGRDGHPYYLDTEGKMEATVGKYIVRALDTAVDKGEEARRCVNLANLIEEAMTEGKDEVSFEENSSLNFIKERVEKLGYIAYIQVLLQEIFEKSEDEYLKRGKNKK